MPSCVPGIDYTELPQYQTPWSCEDLSEIQICSQDRVENCGETKCCISPGSSCYQKDHGWAECGTSCVPRIDDTEQPDQSSWSCEVLSSPIIFPTLPPTLPPTTPPTSPAPTTLPPTLPPTAPPTSPPPTCSQDRVENCAETKCCTSPDSTCYKKDDGWAACITSCVPGIDDTEPPQYQTPWSCEVLSPTLPSTLPPTTPPTSPAPTTLPPTLPPTAPPTSPPPICSQDRVENCAETKCCTSPDSTCYKKDDGWAACITSCVPGIDDTEPPQYQTPWSCEVLSPTLPSTLPPTTPPTSPAPTTLPPTLPPTAPPTSPPPTCSQDRVENCAETKCCTSPDSTCYKKDDGWAACITSCVPGIDDTEPPQYQTPWSCEVLSPTLPSTLPPTTTPTSPAPTTLPPTLPPTAPPTSPPPTCSQDRVENCAETKCCTSPDSTCYKKDDGWAACITSCVPGIDDTEPPQYQTPWSCEVLSPTLPSTLPPTTAPTSPAPTTLPPTLPPTAPPTSPPPTCSQDRVENCAETKCCTSPDSTCYKKDDGWAACITSCVPGIDDTEPPQYQTPWSCEVLSPTLPSTLPPTTAPTSPAPTTLPPTLPPTAPPTSPPPTCSQDRVENCAETKCCTSPDSTCYKKDDGWAACITSCVPGIDDTEPPQYQTPWSCEVLR